jgi:ElaB/YqjD/DUF883 family membrane-anchored ribosome-binding protein
METHFDAIQKSHSHLARERLMDDLKTLVRDAEDLLKVTADQVSDKAKEARSRVATALQQAKSTCQELEQRSMATAKAAGGAADEVIRGHPYEATAVAFGIGLVIGLLVSRR